MSDDFSQSWQKLNQIRSLPSPPESAAISFLIFILSSPDENELVQTAAVHALIRFEDSSSSPLLSLFDETSDTAIQSRISFVLSRFKSVPSSFIEKNICHPNSFVRKNCVYGAGQIQNQIQNPTQILVSSLIQKLTVILYEDPDPTISFEAAETLFRLNPDPSFFNRILQKRVPDIHVLNKIIEISGEIGDLSTAEVLKSYLSDPDDRIVGTTCLSIQKIQMKKK
ncbi:hypothetical protein [Methanolapillus ohkumae]|uniref:HEAT repeat domain-containing protein n=1 Tax=Methanolapillus ohkumae TaxID=3028298 RepID=A0AA96V4H7_9EURY|nr:hypothetical protein MsAm2_01880 [Methanosarcinaceae archaeon Am2]